MVGPKVCLVALLFSLGAAVVRAQAKCDAADAEKAKCFDCFKLGTCDGATGTVTEGNPCAAGEGCVEDRGTAFCAALEYSECNTCGNELTGCDIFDDTKVILCLDSETSEPLETCAEGEKCQSGACVASSEGDLASLCEGNTGLMFVTNKPQCSTGVVCRDAAVAKTKECSDEEYFNLEARSCKSLPVDHCEGKTDGLFPHLTDCKVGVVCQGGRYIMDIPCDEGEIFQDGCVTDPGEGGSAECPAMDGCSDLPTVTANDQSVEPTTVSTTTTETTTPTVSTTTTDTITPTVSSTTTESTTTTQSTTTAGTLKPSSCSSSNVNKRYPHESDCKSYYTCRQINSSTYTYVLSKCSGSLVFNPSTSYCDLASSVPTCAATG